MDIHAIVLLGWNLGLICYTYNVYIPIPSTETVQALQYLDPVGTVKHTHIQHCVHTLLAAGRDSRLV